MYRNFWRVWLFFMITVVVVVAKEFKKRETLSKKEHTRLIWCLVLLKLNQLHRNCVSFLLYYFFLYVSYTNIILNFYTQEHTTRVLLLFQRPFFYSICVLQFKYSFMYWSVHVHTNTKHQQKVYSSLWFCCTNSCSKKTLCWIDFQCRSCVCIYIYYNYDAVSGERRTAIYSMCESFI